VGADAWMSPPFHPNCVLPDTEVDLPPFQSVMRAWYDGDIVEVVADGGSILTVTANHPLLTLSGWKRAAEINEGDYLVGTSAGKSLFVDPNVDHVVPTAKDVFDAAMVSGKMVAGSVPASPAHLHGDGKSVDGQISVVATDGGLVVRANTTLCEHCSKPSLVITDAELPSLTGLGRGATVALALAAAANGCVSLSGVASVLLRSASGHAETVGIDSAALNEAKSLETIGDRSPAVAELLGKTIDALQAFGVKPVQVANVCVRKYAGHVYNFSCWSSVYVSNGIISHNCRCGEMPVQYLEPEK